MGEPFASGQCLCGAVRVVLAKGPVRMVQCHCKDCQRMTGTGHISNAICKVEDVSISGETKTHSVTADSGQTVTRHFCPNCGSRCFNYTTGRPGMISIMVGILDDNSWFTPNAVVYTKRRPPWDITSCDVPNFEGMPQ